MRGQEAETARHLTAAPRLASPSSAWPCVALSEQVTRKQYGLARIVLGGPTCACFKEIWVAAVSSSDFGAVFE